MKENNRFLYIIIFMLIALNMFSIAFFWINRGGERKSQRQKDSKEINRILKDRLSLSPEQEQQFKSIREFYLQKEDSVDLMARPYRDSMNLSLFNEQTDSVRVNRLLNQITELHRTMERLRVEQAEAIKKICTPEQIKKFQSIAFDIRDYFKKPRKK